MDNERPKVTLLTWTQLPLETVYSVWEASKSEDKLRTPAEIASDVSPDEIEELFKAVIAQKIPIGEHVDFVFMLENVSVSWREQAVRHRIGTLISPERVGVDIVPDLAASSFWSQSMRLADQGKFAYNGNYRLPETIAKHPNKNLAIEYHNTMKYIEGCYSLLVKSGIPMEDARELMPLGAQHRISWKLNIGALQHIVGKRGCVTGGTKVPLLDGRSLTMVELLEEYGVDEDFWVYSCDETGRVVPGKARHNGVTQRNAELVEVTLDNGEVIRATPDHRFMKRCGGYARADELAAGQRLMPLYRRTSTGVADKARDRLEGYEEVYQPGKDNWEFTHRVVARSCCEKDTNETVIHHADFDKKNNVPNNLKWMGHAEHVRYHSQLTKNLSGAEQRRRALLAPRELRVKGGKAAAAKGVLVENGQKAAEANRGNKERGEKISRALKKTLSTPEERQKRSERAKRQWQSPKVRAKMIEAISQAAKGDSNSAPEQGGVATDGANHVVVSVRRLKVREDVYDLSVDTHHNYATESGVFIHNCWILQLGIWGPVITGMINELATKVHPVFRELVCPPCLKDDDFTGCIYMEECRRRLTGDDKLPPCPLHLVYHHMATLKQIPHLAELGGALEAVDVPRKDEMMERAEQYRAFWGRDPYTGLRGA